MTPESDRKFTIATKPEVPVGDRVNHGEFGPLEVIAKLRSLDLMPHGPSGEMVGQHYLAKILGLCEPGSMYGFRCARQTDKGLVVDWVEIERVV